MAGYYLGVDGCKGGWLAVILNDDDKWSVDLVPNINILWNKYRNAELILIDIPIGLPEDQEERECDKIARKWLQERRSSVFPVPCRQAVESKEMASEINCKITGRNLSLQSQAILPRIREVDQFILNTPQARDRIREVHPEICFWAFNGNKTMKYSKKRKEGFEERKQLLKSIYPPTEEIINHTLQGYSRKQVARDDILDALVSALTAQKSRGMLKTIPGNPPVDCKYLKMEIVYYDATSMNIKNLR